MSRNIVQQDRTFALRFIIAFAILTVLVEQVQACSCMGTKPACQAVWEADAVFVARAWGLSGLESGENDSLRRSIRLSVLETFRGVEKGWTKVLTGLGGGDCGYPFRFGRTYLVYAYRDQAGRLTTTICSRTRPIDEASEDLAYLKSLGGAPHEVRVTGTLSRTLWDFTYNVRPNQPLVGTMVRAWHESGQWETKTDDEGRFTLSGLPPGRIRVQPILPEMLGFAKARHSQVGVVLDEDAGGRSPIEVDLVPHSCADIALVAHADGRIAGRAVETGGRPAAGVRIEVVRSDGPGKGHAFRPRSAQTDSDGNFELRGIPPGKYFVGVNLYKDPSPDFGAPPFVRTFLPGVADRAQATLVELGEGQRRDNLILHLPQPLQKVAIEVEVVGKDGRPVTAASAYLWTLGDPEDQRSVSQQRTPEGNLLLEAYAGYGFLVEASSAYDHSLFVWGPRQHCGFETIPRLEGPQRLRIVLSETSCGPFERMRRFSKPQVNR